MSATGPTGMYWNARVPFLSILAAICCGSRSERWKFTGGRDYGQFCREGYGLNEHQTRILLVAGDNAPGPDFTCVPTPPQLEAILDELEHELKNKPQAAPPSPAPPLLDPLLSARLPTLLGLYDYYVLGRGQAPQPEWRSALRREWSPELPWYW